MPIPRLFSCVLAACLLAGLPARAEPPTTQPAATQPAAGDGLPYRVIRETRADPPHCIFVVKIDLSDPRVGVRVVPGGPDPDGEGRWQTTLMPVSEIAQRERFDLAVNASFFSIKETLDEQGKKIGYRPGVWASAVGRTVSDGQAWSSDRPDWPVLWIDQQDRARITMPAEIEGRARQVVAGNAWILRKGENQVPKEGMMTQRHPRTAVGVDRAGKTLVILSVDGRRPGVAIGMTGEELCLELQKHNVWDAVNLDGGGSTTLVERNRDDGRYQILNTPSDGRERPVANAIGVTVKEE